MSPAHSITRWVLCLANLSWLVAAVAPARPPAISNPFCPAYPPPRPGTCGPFTYNRCDSNTAGCPFQATSCPSASSTSFRFTEPLMPKDVYVSPEAYSYFKMLEVEYMVEFAKRPMPFEKAIPLPFCGRPKASITRRDEEDADDPLPTSNGKDLQKRFGFKNVFGGKPPGGVLGEVVKVFDKSKPIVVPILDKIKQDFKTAEQLLKEVRNGIAHIDIPFLDKAPKYHPRPVCVPRNLTVPIHFTIFATNYTTSSQVTVDVLLAQVKVLNTAYLDLGIQFYISSFNYHVGEEFRPFAQHKSKLLDEPDKNKAYYSYVERVKQENRYGGFDEINVWIVESLTTPTCDGGVYEEGYCTLARYLTYSDRSVDGCVINMATLPNVTFSDLGTPNGSTLVHEIGHWFDLEHVFPEEDGVGCNGESDGIADSFQFPNDPNTIFDTHQPQCCHSGFGKSLRFFPCPGKNLTHVANYMSYSRDLGVFDIKDPEGTQPWTMGQRAHMFASFFTMRRKPPLGGLDGDCLYYPVFKDSGSASSRRWNTGEFLHTRAENEKRSLLGGGGNVLRQAPKILETLRKVCATDPKDPSSSAIDLVTGEEVQCDGKTCQPPSGGAFCPDGSNPPCELLPDPEPKQKQCLNGSALPCGDDTCPIGTSLSCQPDEGFLCPDGLKPPCNGTLTKPDEKAVENGSCPKACDVHFNKCDATTAPSCIFPDPRVAKPRGACACRPGFKATGASDSDKTKHWRLPVLGQEHRVWVAEGVPCNAPCQGFGFESCREVVMLGKECI